MVGSHVQVRTLIASILDLDRIRRQHVKHRNVPNAYCGSLFLDAHRINETLIIFRVSRRNASTAPTHATRFVQRAERVLLSVAKFGDVQ